MNRRWEAVDNNVGQIREKPIPEPEPLGLVIKVVYSGVCHSDAHLYTTPLPLPLQFPIVLGHEVAGIVHSIGSEKGEDAEEDVSVGDQVVVYPWGGCRNCWVCKSGSQHCMARHNPQAHAYGVFQDGGFQTYVSVKSRYSVVKIPSGIPMDYACLMPCSAVTAYHAVSNIREAVKYAIEGKGQANVLLIGAGGLSLWAMDIIRAMYADKVKLMVADVDEQKLSDAKAKGVNEAICWGLETPSMECSQLIIETFGSAKADAVIDFVAVPSTIERVFPALSNNATLVLVGIFGGAMPPLPIQRIPLLNVTIKGVYTGSKAMVKEMMNFYVEHKLQGPPLEEIGLEDVEGVLVGMTTGKTQKGRAVIKF